MSGNADLRARLAAADPARSAGSPGRDGAPSYDEIQERIVQTLEHPRSPATAAASRFGARRLVAAAAAAVAVAAGAGAALDSARERPAQSPAPTVMALSVAPADVSSSCIRFNVEDLARMPIAFAGRATAVEGASVTLDVDRWYTGGSADRVTVSAQDGQTSAALDGVEFEPGEQYLVSATDGTVSGCGFSGPLTPELETAFVQAFGR